ncbi:Plasma membrane proteolipid [Lachnellula suecica]|uniref:Plasma membrane proteolipid n=1 Tax=Lachnellula suecica TaxID=602035 RepID=A0A8T9BU33_9HELO|nr:Plasma membrane proteolipid [Lachnellula suecica]
MATSSNSDVCLYLFAIFLPPVAVFLKTGCGCDFLINILLCILGWIPGVIRESQTLSPRSVG